MAIIGIVLFALIIAGLIIYTVFLVLEIRRNEEHDSFINSVTHELKTPIASIRLYLETLQSRQVSEAQRREFYDIMLADADRLHHTVDQVLKAGVAREKARAPQSAVPVDMAALARECVDLAMVRHHLGDRQHPPRARTSRPRSWSAATRKSCGPCSPTCSNNAVKYSSAGRAGDRVGGGAVARHRMAARAGPRHRHSRRSS